MKILQILEVLGSFVSSDDFFALTFRLIKLEIPILSFIPISITLQLEWCIIKMTTVETKTKILAAKTIVVVLESVPSWNWAMSQERIRGWGDLLKKIRLLQTPYRLGVFHRNKTIITNRRMPYFIYSLRNTRVSALRRLGGRLFSLALATSESQLCSRLSPMYFDLQGSRGLNKSSNLSSRLVPV